VAFSCIPRRVLNATTRHAVWWVTLAVAMCLPALFLPVSRRPAAADTPRTGSAKVMEPAPAAGNPVVRVPEESVLPGTRYRAQIHGTAAPKQVPELAPPAVTLKSPSGSPSRFAGWGGIPRAASFLHLEFPVRLSAARWLPGAMAAWLLASLFMLIRLGVSYALLGRLCRRAREGPPHLQQRVAELLARCHTHRRVRVLTLPEIAVPVAVGPRRPAILIPSGFLTALDDEQLEQVCLHEAAHLVRRDDCALLAERLLQAVFVLQPVVAWICRRIDLEREIACDDLVLSVAGRPRSYAWCLTRVAELGGRAPASLIAAAAVDNHSQLARRVEMLLDRTRHRGTALLKGRFGAGVAILALAVWLSSYSPALVAFTAVARSLAALANPQSRPLVAALLPTVAASEEPAQLLEGRVVEDSSGSPLPSVELRFHQAGMLEMAADLETDGDGRFRAEGLPPGKYTVDVAKPNYIATRIDLHVPSPAVFLRLVRYGAIDGQATDGEGRPLPGRIGVDAQGRPMPPDILAPNIRTAGSARVAVLVRAPAAGGLRVVRDMALEDNGRYRFHDLPPGEYAVGLWYSGLDVGSGVQLFPDSANPRFFTVQGGEDYSDVDFQVSSQPAYSVSGRIELPAGKAQFQLSLGLPEQPLLPVGQAVSEPDGSFRFAKVPAGTYTLFAAGPVGGGSAFLSLLGEGQRWFGRLHIQVGAQDLTGVAVPLATERSVNVVLRGPAGSAQPPEGCPKSAAVSATPAEPWSVMLTGRSPVVFGKEQAVGKLPPGKVNLVATDLGAACYQAKPAMADLSAETPAPVAIELASAGSIRGTLKSAAAPVADLAVVLLAAGNAEDTQPRLAYPDEQGHFAFTALPPGHYRLAAHPRTNGARERWVALGAHALEIDVAGGAPSTVELTAEGNGDRP